MELVKRKRGKKGAEGVKRGKKKKLKEERLKRIGCERVSGAENRNQRMGSESKGFGE